MKKGHILRRLVAICVMLVLILPLMPIPQANAVPTDAEVKDKISWIIAGIPDTCDTDYEKALWLHDYLCATVTYEADLGDESYTALIDGVADCGGYASAYQELLNAVGIQSAVVIGTAAGGPHAWNMVMLDGQCYYTDVTWDDLDKAYNSYQYFNVTYDEMEKNHDGMYYDPAYLRPSGECNHTKYQYVPRYEVGSGYGNFNPSTTPAEAAKYFKLDKISGSEATFGCIFEFDGNIWEWLPENFREIARLLGYGDIYHHEMLFTATGGGLTLRGECSFTSVESVAFSQNTVYLNSCKERQQLSVNVAPANATYQDITYTSSDPRIAKVDENGVVRAISTGTATITATTPEGKTATCQVVVGQKIHDAVRAVPASSANCMTEGYLAHYQCNSCGTRVSDAKGENWISIMDVVIPTTSHITRIGQHNEEGCWVVCICGKELMPILPHMDYDGDGICNRELCNYVMNPGATQPTNPPTQPPTVPPTVPPTQHPTVPVTEPTIPESQPTTEAPTVPTDATEPSGATDPTEEPVPPTESAPGTEPGTVPTTSETTKPSAETTQPGSNPEAAPPAEPSVLPWVVIGIVGAAAVIVIVIVIVLRRKR